MGSTLFTVVYLNARFSPCHYATLGTGWRCGGFPKGRSGGPPLDARAPAPARPHRAGATPDANGQALAYIYSRANQAEALQAKVLTEDEARRIAANIAKLPDILKH